MMKNYRFINSDYYALVTGGSEGIGFAFADRLASLGKPVIIVALDNQKLREAQDAISNKYGVDCRTLGIDLTCSNAAETVLKWCCKNGLVVDFLINNAGLGDTHRFHLVDKDMLNRMIMLNVYATADMCRLFIGEMDRNVPAGYVVNVSSLAAFFPIPYKGLYAGSKAFVNVFTRALSEEFRLSNVKLHVVCPNGVLTNDAVRARMAKHGKMAAFLGLEPDYLVDYTFRRMENGRFMIIPKFVNRVLHFMSKNVPQGLQLRVLGKQFGKEIEKT